MFLCSAKFTSVENLDNEFSPLAFPSLSVVDPLAQQCSIKQHWLQQRANSLPLALPKAGPNQLSVDTNSCLL